MKKEDKYIIAGTAVGVGIIAGLVYLSQRASAKGNGETPTPTFTAVIRGDVVDYKMNPIPGAKVEVSKPGTGKIGEAITDSLGKYQISFNSAVPPLGYQIKYSVFASKPTYAGQVSYVAFPTGSISDGGVDERIINFKLLSLIPPTITTVRGHATKANLPVIAKVECFSKTGTKLAEVMTNTLGYYEFKLDNPTDPKYDIKATDTFGNYQVVEFINTVPPPTYVTVNIAIPEVS